MQRIYQLINRIFSKLKRELMPLFTLQKGKKFHYFFAELDVQRYKTIIVLETHFGWDTLLKQRPQQIASHFGDDVLFLYHSSRDKYDTKYCFKNLKKGLYLVNLDLYRKKLSAALKDFPNKYVMTYSTDTVGVMRIKNYQRAGFQAIYEYVDMIDSSLSGNRRTKQLLKKRDTLLADKSVYAVCTANRLFDSLNGRNKTALITNGCDYEFFAENASSANNGDIIQVGYYGVLANWMDYELIKKIAAVGRYKVILFGNQYDDSLVKSGILHLSNVSFAGKVDYDELPIRASAFDICIIPFLINAVTLATSPVKLFEYLAMGKPVVSTALPECKKYPCVFVADNPEDFLDKLIEAEKVARDPAFISLAKRTALENSWQSKCTQLQSFLREE